MSRSQAGVFTPLMGMLLLVFAVLLVGVIHIGLLVAARSDAQRAVDAAAQSAALTLRDHVRPATDWKTGGIAVGNLNTVASMNNWLTVDKAQTLEISLEVSHPVAGLPPFPARVVVTKATTQVQQQGFWDEKVEWLYPKLALVLDYSGSMTAPFAGGGSTKDLILRAAVSDLVDGGLRIDFGAVFFSSGILNTVAFNPGNSASVISQIHSRSSVPSTGETNTGLALKRARNMLVAEEDTGRYVMLVSDGAPCCAANAKAAAVAATDLVWAANAEIFSIEIQDVPPVTAFTQSMKRMAGGKPSDVSPWYINLSSAAALLATFSGIKPHAVCRTKILSPEPSDVDSLQVYLSIGGERPPNAPTNEVRMTAVPPTGKLVDYSGDYYYIYDEVEKKLYLSEAACIVIKENGGAVVARFDPITLIR